MQAAQQTSQIPGIISHDEIAALVKMLRTLHQWSQEDLAEAAGLSSRTIQRIERGIPSDFNSRRALGEAFAFEDSDFLNKPFSSTEEEALAAEKVKYIRGNITLKVLPLDIGKLLAQMIEATTMDMTFPTFAMSRQPDEAFAALIDCFRDYRDSSDSYSEVQKFEVYDELQSYMDTLKAMKVSLVYATCHFHVKTNGVLGEPWQATALVVAACREDDEPKFIKVPRDVKIGRHDGGQQIVWCQ